MAARALRTKGTTVWSRYALIGRVPTAFLL